jgi:hypothetical protein
MNDRKIGRDLPRYTSRESDRSFQEKDNNEQPLLNELSKEIRDSFEAIWQAEFAPADEQTPREFIFSKSVCPPNVIWFLFSEFFFSKNKLYDPLIDVPKRIYIKLETKYEKEFRRFSGLLADLGDSTLKEPFQYFSQNIETMVS